MLTFKVYDVNNRPFEFHEINRDAYYPYQGEGLYLFFKQEGSYLNFGYLGMSENLQYRLMNDHHKYPEASWYGYGQVAVAPLPGVKNSLSFYEYDLKKALQPRFNDTPPNDLLYSIFTEKRPLRWSGSLHSLSGLSNLFGSLGGLGGLSGM